MKKPARKQSPAAPEPAKSEAQNRGSLLPSHVRLQVCFFLSGAAGLIDQVVWTKSLGQLFGYSAYAVATVLGVFMGGLALGSALFSRWRPWKATGVALYAWLESGIAATALLSLPGIALVRQIYFAVDWHLGGSPILLLALRFAGVAIVLALPTILMGGTFPVLLSGLACEANERGIRVGRFYAINTAGAVAGALAAGFVLIPWMGLRATLGFAVLLNVIAGFVAYRLAQRSQPVAEEASANAADAPGAASGNHERLYLFCFAGVGATAIAYELSWTRMLATPLGSSTYAFSLMLATFLSGLAIGSAIFENWFRKRRQSTANLFALTQLAIAAAVLVSLWMFREIPEILLQLLRSFGGNFSSLVFAQALACAIALLPTAILFGFNFPAVLALLSKATAGSSAAGFSSGIGRGIAANTAGAILAALAGGFLLLPLIGSFRLAALAGCVNVILGVILLFVASRRAAVPLAVSALMLGAFAWTAWSPAFFSQATAAFGVVVYGDFHNSTLTAREMADTEDVLFFKDGINSTIAVTRAENYVALKTNGKVDASNLDESTQLLLGDLGAVFSRNPRKVLVIGFGGGMTVSAVARFPEVERIDCVEIEPGVIAAARHLKRLHRGVEGDGRLHIYFDDARNFLQTSHEKYDLIISEPSNPWIAGIASLYTGEFFGVVRSHLAPGGNFVQWIQAYGLTPDDFAMILGGIAGQFPDLSLWKSAGRDFLVLARTSTEPLSFERSRALWSNEPLRKDFEALSLSSPEGWPAFFRLGGKDIRAFASGARSNTDDRTILEYSVPRTLKQESLTARLDEVIDRFETRILPEDLPQADLGPALLGSLETSLEIFPHRAKRFLEPLVKFPSLDVQTRQKVQVLADRDLIADKEFATAIEGLKRDSIQLDNRFNAQYWLAIAQRGAGLRSEALATLDDVLARESNHRLALEAKVAVSSERKEWQSAIEAQLRLAALRPDLASAQCELGDLYLRAGDRAAAGAPFRRGLDLDPYTFLCHRDLGELDRVAGQAADAINELRWVVKYFPEADAKTYVSLALAYQTAGKRAEAQAALDKGKRIFPRDQLLQRFSLRN